jgi:hypothetical protein
MEQGMLFYLKTVFLIGGFSFLNMLAMPIVQDEIIDESKVKQLVRQLDDDALAKRETAEQQLVELGPAILPVLDQIQVAQSSESSTRLMRIRYKLQQQQIENYSKATTVTLNGEMTIADVFAAIEKQTGNKFGGIEDRANKLNLDLDDVPTMEALDQILDDAKLQIDPFDFQGDVHTVRARPIEQLDRSGVAAYPGAFRVEATRIDSVRDLRNPELSGMRIQLEIGWEPRISPIAVEIPTEQIKMLDEFGDPINVGFRGFAISNDIQSGAPLGELILPTELPDHETWKIAKMEATMNVLLPGPKQMFRFENVGTSVDKSLRIGEATVKIEDVSKNVDIYGISVRLEFDEASNALESHRGWIFNNSLALVDAEGKKILPIGSETMAQDDNFVTIQYLFDSDIDPNSLALEYVSPTAIIKLPVKFELKNIKLP